MGEGGGGRVSEEEDREEGERDTSDSLPRLHDNTHLQHYLIPTTHSYHAHLPSSLQ